MTTKAKIELIKKLGLSHEEINQFGVVLLLNYLKFHHKKHYGTSSILFLGFSEYEVEKLNRTAIQSNLKVKTRFSSTLIFACTKTDFIDEKRIKKAKESGTIILTENEFLELFKESEYKIQENELIFPTTVLENFRIVIPLSNFNENVHFESFSNTNENTYLTNLFTQTCNCKEFSTSAKSNYAKGDLRRFCKHLISVYKESFTPKDLSEFITFLIENQYSLKRNVKEIYLEKISLPIYLSYENTNDWCDIYFPIKESISKYSYNYKEQRFSYDNKPFGHVATLKAELNKIFGEKKQVKKINKETIYNQNKGCTSVLIMSLFMIFIFIFLIN
ncbi:MAG: hypothetical protein KA210_03075 [Bacteroidia bacterium]|nr:hypothetical protein [Bacteroidia bacterium]